MLVGLAGYGTRLCEAGLRPTCCLQAVCLLAVTKPGRPPLELDSLRTWAQDKLSKPQTPTRLLLMDALPRNAMGKINKKELRKLVPEE